MMAGRSGRAHVLMRSYGKGYSPGMSGFEWARRVTFRPPTPNSGPTGPDGGARGESRVVRGVGRAATRGLPCMGGCISRRSSPACLSCLLRCLPSRGIPSASPVGSSGARIGGRGENFWRNGYRPQGCHRNGRRGRRDRRCRRVDAQQQDYQRVYGERGYNRPPESLTAYHAAPPALTASPARSRPAREQASRLVRSKGRRHPEQ